MYMCVYIYICKYSHIDYSGKQRERERERRRQGGILIVKPLSCTNHIRVRRNPIVCPNRNFAGLNRHKRPNHHVTRLSEILGGFSEDFY